MRQTDEGADDVRPITAAANIWQVGAVMYSLMTLDGIYTVSDQVDSITEAEYTRFGGNLFPDITVVDITTGLPVAVYSRELREAVLACLRLEPDRRPTAAQLRSLTEAQLHFWAHSRLLETTQTGEPYNNDGPKVYYKGAEINSMPQGDYVYGWSKVFWRKLQQREAWMDPNAEHLEPPMRPGEMTAFHGPPPATAPAPAPAPNARPNNLPRTVNIMANRKRRFRAADGPPNVTTRAQAAAAASPVPAVASASAPASAPAAQRNKRVRLGNTVQAGSGMAVDPTSPGRRGARVARGPKRKG